MAIMKFTKILVVMTLSILFLSACSIPFGDGKLKISTDGVTITDEKGEDVTIDFNVDEENGTGGITFTDDQGEEVSIDFNVDGEEGEITFGGSGGEDGAMKIGTDLNIPESFPKEIPFPATYNIIQTLDLPDQIQIHYITDSEIDEITDMYEKFLHDNGITDLATSKFGDEENYVVQYHGNLNNNMIFFSIMSNNNLEDDYITQVSIGINKEANE